MRKRAPRSAAANTITAASSQVVANNISRQMIPTKTKAGGVSANSGSKSANRLERRAIAKASKPKPSQ